MTRTCRAPTCKGFSLIEVIVALAITAMIIAATATSVLVSERTADSAHFHQEARSVSAQLLLRKIVPGEAEGGTNSFANGVTVEEETMAPGNQQNDPAWIVYRIHSTRGNNLRMALSAGASANFDIMAPRRGTIPGDPQAGALPP